MATAIPANLAPFTVEEIAAATGGIVVRSGAASVGVCTDSRAVTAGAAFVALTGEKFDGHAFLESVVALGARTLVVSRDEGMSARAGAPAVVKVRDTRAALGGMARVHRVRWGRAGQRRLIAVTGSAGKTTTKSVLARVLDCAAPGAVHATLGNLNNDVGVPMTLFGLQDAHRFAVVEVGTNARGEIAGLASICQPDVSIVTLVAAAHTEGIGGIDDVAVEKGDLFAALPASGLAVANADDTRVLGQLARSRAGTSITYGFSKSADYRVVEASSRGARGVHLRLARPAGAIGVDSALLGDAGALAVAASLAVAEWVLGRAVTDKELTAALSGREADGRLTPVELQDGTIVVDDSYNANPASMRASLAAASDVAKSEGRRLVAVLGEMRELGALSAQEHDALGLAVGSSSAAIVIAVGGDAVRVTRAAMIAGKTTFFAADAKAAVDVVLANVAAGDVVLVKGSRGVGTDVIVRALSSARGSRDVPGGAA